MFSYPRDRAIYPENLRRIILENIDYPEDVNQNYKSREKCFDWKGKIDKYRRPVYHMDMNPIPVRVIMHDNYYNISDNTKFIRSLCKNSLCVNPLHHYQSQYLTDYTVSREIAQNLNNPATMLNKSVNQKKLIDSLNGVLNYEVIDIEQISKNLDIYDSVLIDFLNTAQFNFICKHFSEEQIENIINTTIPLEYTTKTYECIEDICRRSKFCFDCFEHLYQPSYNNCLCQSCFLDRVQKYNKEYSKDDYIFFNLYDDNIYKQRLKKFIECYAEQDLSKDQYFNAFVYLNGSKYVIATYNWFNKTFQILESKNYAKGKQDMPVEGRLKPNEIHYVEIKVTPDKKYKVIPLKHFCIDRLNQQISKGKMQSILDKYFEEKIKEKVKEKKKFIENYFEVFNKPFLEPLERFSLLKF